MDLVEQSLEQMFWGNKTRSFLVFAPPQSCRCCSPGASPAPPSRACNDGQSPALRREPVLAQPLLGAQCRNVSLQSSSICEKILSVTFSGLQIVIG